MSLQQRITALAQAVGADIKQLQQASTPGSFFSLVTVAATSASQTSFTIPGGYTPGAIVVFLNGSSLAPAYYTATNGSAVILGSGTGVAVGSELVVLRLSAFQVADALPLGGTAADSIKLGGNDAAEFYRRANILGTVSQLSGLPTGAIIERGSNANGEYVRFADGTQICWAKSSTLYSSSTAYASVYRSSAGARFTFPAAFSSTPFVRGALDPVSSNIADVHSEGGFAASPTQTSSMYIISYFSMPQAGYIGYVAIGRWL